MYKYSLSLVFRRKLRTFLTSLGITISVVLLSLIIFGMLGVRNVITGELDSRFKPNQVIVSTQDYLQAFGAGGGTATETEESDKEPTFITPKIMEEIKSIDNVKSASPQMDINVFQAELEDSNLKAYPTAFITALDINTDRNFFKEVVADKLSPNEGEIFIGDDMAGYFGLDRKSAIGKTIILKPSTESFFSQRTTSVLSLEYKLKVAGFIDAGADRADGFINLELASKMLADLGSFESGEEYLNTFGYDRLIISLDDSSDVKTKVSDFKTLMKDKYGLNTISSDDILSFVDQVTVVLTLALTLFGIISAFVASIGIINTMVMSIYEQTREIGIIKSIGASNLQVLKIFLIQSGTIGLLGGLQGIIFVVLVTTIANPIIVDQLKDQGLSTDTFFVLNPIIIAVIILVSILVGILAGIYPAIKAARLDPVKALRYE